jgi:hypothetical protein
MGSLALNRLPGDAVGVFGCWRACAWTLRALLSLREWVRRRKTIPPRMWPRWAEPVEALQGTELERVWYEGERERLRV